MASLDLTRGEARDPGVAARVAALRQLSEQDSVPAIQQAMQLCKEAAELKLPRVSPFGRQVGRLFPVRPLSLRFQSPPEFAVQEAAIVFGAALTDDPHTVWQGREVLELGCGTGFLGIVLAGLGARVVLTDLPKLENLALASIALNAGVIKPPGSARFWPLDWRQPRMSRTSAFATARFIVASEPVADAESMQLFLQTLRALTGLDGEDPLCPLLEEILISHKHRPTLCIGGYSAPAEGAAPAVVNVQDHDRCLFMRSLVDAGFQVQLFHRQPPKPFVHPFVECWSVRR